MLISEIIRYYLLRVSKLILIVSNYDKILLKFESLYQYIFTYHTLTLFTRDFFSRTCYATQQINRILTCERTVKFMEVKEI